MQSGSSQGETKRRTTRASGATRQMRHASRRQHCTGVSSSRTWARARLPRTLAWMIVTCSATCSSWSSGSARLGLVPYFLARVRKAMLGGFADGRVGVALTVKIAGSSLCDIRDLAVGVPCALGLSPVRADQQRVHIDLHLIVIGGQRLVEVCCDCSTRGDPCGARLGPVDRRERVEPRPQLNHQHSPLFPPVRWEEVGGIGELDGIDGAGAG
eukprot:scaffold244784_cov35-Tisochrysis_lutea.AAC.4